MFFHPYAFTAVDRSSIQIRINVVVKPFKKCVAYIVNKVRKGSGQVEWFVKKHLLRKNEEIEWIEEERNILLGYIVRRTPRTYRRLARIMITKEMPSEIKAPQQELLKQRLSIHRSKVLSFPQERIRQWLMEGFIVQKMRLSDDGRTSQSTTYWMGPALYQYQKRQAQKKSAEQEKQFNTLQNKLQKYVAVNNFQPLEKYIQKILAMDVETFAKDPFLLNWSRIKRMKFLEFLIALLSLRQHKKMFDFKEIGAFYYREIGGSKAFDRYREDFIRLLEDWVGEKETIGLISQGKIMPIFFSGQVKGKYASFYEGSLHALTDVSLIDDHFTTKSKVLWLVENRAMLTRMNASPKFIKETSSLVICLDGHVRSAQKKFIHQLLQSDSIEQVMIWTDYDPSGLAIANEAYELLDPSLVIKWISAEGEVYFNQEAYVNWLKQKMKSGLREQEEVLGDEEQWMKWIKA